MPVVIDASVTIAWALEDEESVESASALARVQEDGAVVPSLWFFEVRTILLISEGRGRTTRSATSAFLRELSALPITTDRSPLEAELLSLARQQRLTVYDAAYLELAGRERLALATFDPALMRAAREIGVALFGA